MSERTLPPFPTDDFTLDQLEHALNTCRGSGDELVGGDFTLSQLLDFYSGYDAAKLIDLGMRPGLFGGEDVQWTEYPDAVYSERDVMRALIAKIRSLRGGGGMKAEVVHKRHFQDGYPLCWPMDREGEFAGSFDEGEVTCPECRDLCRDT